MRKKIIATPLDIRTIAIDNIPNRYGPFQGLVEKIIYVEILFNYSSHHRVQIWNTNQCEAISFKNMDKSCQDFYGIMTIVMLQIV